MALRLPFPTIEQRTHLLQVDYADDPEPPACEQHGNPCTAQLDCDVCYEITLWRGRMRKRFSRAGLRFTVHPPAPPTGPGPRPPACPDQHPNYRAAAARCGPCRLIRNWRNRLYRCDRRDGISRWTDDIASLRAHVKLLRESGMTHAQIARAAQCGIATVKRIASDAYDGQHVTTTVVERLLAIDVPEHRFTIVPDVTGATLLRIDATGTHRRLRAACLAAHSLHDQADRLGYHINSVRGWLQRDTVSIVVAEDVRALYPKLIAEPGDDLAAVTRATRLGWMPARYFTDANIDDPAYRPTKRIRNVGVRRRLRALAWMGQGPDQVAEHMHESPADVRRWTDGATYPAYVEPFVDAAFEALSGTFGPDRAAADNARAQGWAPPLAWYDVDIDDQRRHAQFDLPRRDSPHNYPLESQVLQALLGIVAADDLVRDEKYVAVRILHRAGRKDGEIAVALRWPGTDLAAAADGVCKYRTRAGIGTDVRKPPADMAQAA